MRRTIKVSLNPDSIKRAIRELEALKRETLVKRDLMIQKLAQRGLTALSDHLADHVWSGDTLASIRAEEIAPGKYRVSAASTGLLFLEFGAGALYAAQQHPLAGQFGMTPGSNSPGGKWDDPNGWWYFDEFTGRMRHSFGRPASMPVYRTAKDIENAVREVVAEVYGA